MKHAMGVLLGLLTLLAQPVELMAGQSVTVTGMSFFESGREALAREKALEDAKRGAIEQAVGAFVESSSYVENFNLVKDRIFSHASGYLKEFKIVEEKKTDLGTYEVTIQAEVETAALAGDMDRFRQMLNWQKNPRIRIVIEPGLASDVRPAATKAANLLAGKLKRSGFIVYRTEGQSPARMGLLVGLAVESATTESDYQGVRLSLNEISLSGNVYRPGDDQILATAAAVRSVPGTNRLQALDKGVRACIDALWAKLQGELTRLWESEVYGERELFLTLTHVATHNRALEIAAVFESDVGGVMAVDLMQFDPQGAQYRLRYRGRPETLDNEVQMSYFRKTHFRLKLEKIAGNEMVMRLE